MRTCGNCALMRRHNGVCPIFSKPMDANEGGCPLFTSELNICDLCGRPIVGDNAPTIRYDGDEIHVICHHCATVHTCGTCKKGIFCAFAEDQSCREPQVIMKTERQGNMVVQSQVPNPKRIEATCAKGCPCYTLLDDGTYICCRQLDVNCVNYEINWSK